MSRDGRSKVYLSIPMPEMVAKKDISVWPSISGMRRTTAVSERASPSSRSRWNQIAYWM